MTGALASVTCLLLFGCFATDYLGMNDPQLMGQALGMAGLAVWLTGGSERPYRAAIAALLLAGSVLIKHNLILLPLLVAFDALRNGSRRAGLTLIGTGALAGITMFGLIALWNGPAFLEQLLAPRTWQVDRAFLFTSEVLERLAAPVVVVGLGLIAARRVRPAGLVLAWLVLALALGAYFSGGAGTDINVWFDLYLALAVGAGMIAREARSRGATPMQDGGAGAGDQRRGADARTAGAGPVRRPRGKVTWPNVSACSRRTAPTLPAIPRRGAVPITPAVPARGQADQCRCLQHHAGDAHRAAARRYARPG